MAVKEVETVVAPAVVVSVIRRPGRVTVTVLVLAGSVVVIATAGLVSV